MKWPIELNPDLNDAPLFPELLYYWHMLQKWWAMKHYGVIVKYQDTDVIGRF